MERSYIVSAFIDLRGFGTWIYRASIPKEIKEPFIMGYLDIVQIFIKERNDLHFKYLGDGFLAIKEIGTFENRDIAIRDFITGLIGVTKKILKLLKDCNHPPDGVRVRITEGYAYKVKVIDPCDNSRNSKNVEFIEYCINTAERLMEVNPEIICLVTEGVSKALGQYRSFFRMGKLGQPSCYPKSVNKEDLETLEILKV